jgi:hypothetical protein
MQGAAIVVVPWGHVQRGAEGSEESANLAVFGVRGVVCEIAGDEHGIGPRPDRSERFDRGGEPRHGIAAGPFGADVGIAQMGEHERSSHEVTSSRRTKRRWR